MASRALRPGPGYRVFIDFDNTITLGDVLDGVIERFAVGDEWRVLEDEWAAGRIGARACLDGQMRALHGTWPDFVQHLDTVKLDPGFVALRDLLRQAEVELTIVSDNFDRFIAHILRQQQLADVPFFANRLECRGDRVIPSFPHANPACPDCAHCKKTHFLPPNDDARRVVYIGDGRSDLCPSRHADLVFAKSSLLARLRAEGVPCIAYDTLAQVTAHLSEIIHERRS